MSHEIEIVNGKAQHVYVGETPWHGLGTQVPHDLTPVQMLEAAGLDWSVEKYPATVEINGKRIQTGHQALVRSSDSKILDVITDDWNPCQNLEAFEFFNDFIGAGDMEMHTAGSLKGGKVVWALAKVNDSFELFDGDRVESYLLFTNPHQYGQSIDIRFTPIRVVCNNTLTLSLNTKSSKMAKVSHARVFNPDEVKETLGVAKEKLQTYKEMAAFLGSKRYTEENVVEYFKRIFPGTSTKKELSKNARMAHALLETQPGAEYAEGTWWTALNAVTHMTDHVIGRSVDARLTSAWFGANKGLKGKAIDLAVEMAEAS
jgi:hypothetical protein